MRIDAGTRTCVFEKGNAGQILEFYYQVLDGQHGDLDISADVFDPRGNRLVADNRKSQSSVIIQLEHSGDYVFCLDNTHSLINSKLVYLSITIEDEKGQEGEVTVVDDNGEEEILEWVGIDENGASYSIEVEKIVQSLTHTLKIIVKAKHLLDKYSANKSRDVHLAAEDIFIVDAWSLFQISFMMCVGFTQVYLIKRLFNKPCDYNHHL
ncbi:unnamed protein product [Leptidea sinapis]|uniref:GOLD domain-containing protein n=1 Tax=Leptidea sinapis TaxID=189913 RepID=A0A5E4Q2P3_9NEOP|nr:unnamed protein product [Leptidea sinapis]